MRIVYLHQYFVSPKATGRNVTGTRSYEFARRFAEAGHEVHMVCSDWLGQHGGSPGGANAAGENAGEKTGGTGASGSWREELLDGIHVHALPLSYSNKLDYAARVKVFLRFAWLACRRAASLGGDVIFATSTPLTIAIPGIWASFRSRAPMVFEVRDLWPEAPREMGVLTNPALLWAAETLERQAYRRAAHVVALSPGMRDGVIAAGVPAERVTMIPNACDLSLFHPGVNGQAMRARLGLGDRVAFLYFGTMGPANGLGFVLDGAAELKRRGETRAVFVLHGDGKDRPALEARKASEGLDNVIFSNPLEGKAKVAEIVAAADVGMTIYKNLPVLYTCSPNKMFDTLAAGRPVLTNMPGWLGGLVEDNDCGVFVEPDDPVSFADKVQGLVARRDQLPDMGRRARALAERQFSRDVLAGELLTLLERVAGKTRPTTARQSAA
jgi:glycosyltransferase involved in cell wall biosynthesis